MKQLKRIGWMMISLSALLLVLASCASVDPRQVDVELKEEPPAAKITSFTEALTELGKMTEIYATRKLKVQSKDIADNTGTAGATGGEVPRDITEMLKSTLNAIGGKVMYIPYNPAFIQNQMVTGYSTFENKIIPDVVITGGITEFDRGLETRGSNIDAGVEADFTHAPSWAPNNSASIDYGAGDKYGLASITLDFNMIDFQTMAGIAKMQTVNSIKVSKAVSEKELAISLLGPTFGLKGSIKKVQGRHAAVRLLVQLSMIQIIGKHMMLPYWKLLPDADPDPVVMEALKKEYYQMDEAERIVKVQELLFIQGYDVTISGEMDPATLKALQQVVPGAAGINRKTYLAVYFSVPITEDVLERRMELNKAYAALAAPPEVAAPPAAKEPAKQTVEQQPEPAKPDQEVASAPAEPPAEREEASKVQQPPAQKKNTPGAVKDGIGGRMLTEDEW